MSKIIGAGGGSGGGGGGKGGGGGGGNTSAYTPTEAADNLASTAYVNIVDALGEGEIQGFATPERGGISKSSAAYDVELLKDIYVNNTPVLRSAAVVKTGTYSQNSTTITVTCNAHGYAVNSNVVLSISSGLATAGTYKITAATANTFTAVGKNTNITSGNLAIAKPADYNFKNFNLLTRYGTANQSTIPGFGRVESEQTVNTVVEYDVPIVRTITNSNVDAVRISVTVPSLQRFESNGDINGSGVRLRIDLSEDGGGYYTALENTISGRTADQYQRDYEISLAGKSFPIDLRVVRVSADSTSAKVQNTFSWSSYTEITEARLTYPNTALVATRVSAEQFNSIPSRSFKVRGRKVAIPSNATVDLATGALIYNGVWDGTFAAAAWTSDPAWCLWNLLTDYRAGFGDQLDASQLDRWAFYSASRYCSALDTYLTDGRTGTTNDYNATTGKHGIPNGFGGYEPRFSCNTNIQTQEEAYKLINDLCSVFRVMPYWATGALTISQDAPADASYLFTLANVTEGGFSYTTSSQKTKPSVVLVGYLDTETRDTAFEQVEDQDAIKRFGVVTQEISAFACTSRGQARRLGEWFLYSNNYEAEVVSFTASIDAGVVVRPGQIINIADPLKAGSRRGGRISAATTTTVTVDNAIDLPASGGTLSVIMPDGTVEAKTVSSRVDSVVTVSSAFTTAPNVNSIWVYENSSIQTSSWRVLSVAEQEQCQYAISAVSYNSSKYDYIERDQQLQARDISDLNEPPDTPTGLTLTETLYTYQAEVRAKVIANWVGVSGAASYQVRWRKDDGNWEEVETLAPDYEILNITPGVFDLEIYAVSGAGKFSNEALTGSITALGKTAPPSDVSGLNYTVDIDLGVLLTWSAVADLDIDTYEVRRGTNWGTATLLTKVKATTYKLGYLDDGTYTYLVKAIDTSGVYSTNAATIAVTVNEANATTISSSVQGRDLVLSWTVPAASTYAIAYYNVTYGGAFGTSTVLARTNSTSFTVPISWIGARTFWVAPVDLIGRFTDPPDSEVVTISGAPAPTINTVVGGRTATLTWTAVAGTLPTDTYEIRQGATFSTATVLASVTATSFTLNASWTGSQTFWVVAKDANGNYGTQGSATITVDTAAAPALAASFSGQNAVFSWSAIKGTLDTQHYLLKRGATWASGTTVATISATTYTVKADWGGSQKFWLAAVDVNGSEGTPDDADVTVTIPSAPTITQQVIDNNVLLKWTDSTQTLPIISYELRRGASWAAGTVIGTKQGGFTTVFETAAGTYTYWLAGIDSAGNYGTPGSVVAVVNQPPDYVLQYDQNSTWAGDETNIYTDALLGQIVNVNTTETWESHFTSRSYTSPQDQIDAGYTYYLMPSTTTAAYEEEFDYGTLLASTKVSATLTSSTVAGATTVTPTIRVRGTASTSATYSQATNTITVTSTAHGLAVGDYVYLDFTTGTATDGTYVVVTSAANSFTVTSTVSATTSGNVSWVKWTSYAGLSEVYVTQFRYFRVRYDFTSVGGNDLMLLSGLNVRLDVKLISDSGAGTANSADSGGTTVNFNIPFVDVDSIAVTPTGTSAVIAVYDFVDAPNPTGFKVLLFNTSGTRVSGGFSWSARGV